MAKGAFDFSDMFSNIENGINKLMSSSESTDLLAKYVEVSAAKNVYAQYFPTQYERRYTLYDDDTFEVTTGRLTMSITSWARGEGKAGIYLTDVIESGIGYEWTKSDIYAMQPYPRPFMEAGVNDFVDGFLLPAIHTKFFDD